MNTQWWEWVLLTLAVIGCVGSFAAIGQAHGDLVWIKKSKLNGRYARRVLVARGHLFQTFISAAIQLAVATSAFIYVTNDSIGRDAVSWQLWTIRGSFITIELLLLAQIVRRHRDRERLVEMIQSSENHEGGENG